jgi:hypothetical protein
VPVEADGSAYFSAPALRSLIFVALDEQDLSVKRMQSFATVMPGETVGCTGCHEPRTKPPTADAPSHLLALARGPSRLEPISEVPDVLDFPRDIQPILDRHGRDRPHRRLCHRAPLLGLPVAPAGEVVES